MESKVPSSNDNAHILGEIRAAVRLDQIIQRRFGRHEADSVIHVKRIPTRPAYYRLVIVITCETCETVTPVSYRYIHGNNDITDVNANIVSNRCTDILLHTDSLYTHLQGIIIKPSQSMSHS